MKQNVNPIVGGAVVAVLLLVVGLLVWRGSRVESASNGEKPPGMPPNVATEFNRRMSTVAPTGTAPTGTR